MQGGARCYNGKWLAIQWMGDPKGAAGTSAPEIWFEDTGEAGVVVVGRRRSSFDAKSAASERLMVHVWRDEER